MYPKTIGLLLVLSASAHRASGDDRSATRVVPALASAKDTNRIVGGVPADRPFVAALVFERDGVLHQYCGATILASTWLLTAAHCQVELAEKAIINRSDLSNTPGEFIYGIRAVHVHPGFKRAGYENDLALVKLDRPIPGPLTEVRLLDPPPAGDEVIAAGWGSVTEGGSPSLKLREAKVRVVSNDSCRSSYGLITENMLCAGGAGKDSCQGDSGGPLFQLEGDRWVKQVGVTSHGTGCGRPEYPGVYTRVTPYLPWIQSTMKN